jgi:hypothetical protein
MPWLTEGKLYTVSRTLRRKSQMQLRVMDRRLALRMVKEEDIWKGKFTCCLILPNLPAGRSAKRVDSAMLFTRTTTHFIFYLTLVPKMTTSNSFVLSTSTTRTGHCIHVLWPLGQILAVICKVICYSLYPAAEDLPMHDPYPGRRQRHRSWPRSAVQYGKATPTIQDLGSITNATVGHLGRKIKV